MYAVFVFKGKESIVKLLLDNYADPNSVDAEGETALLLAVQNGII